MGFKRTPEGRVFFQGTDSANDEAAPLLGPKGSGHSGQMRGPMTSEKTQTQILTLLKTLNERLQATQKDRDNMKQELDEYRSTIEGLEEKSDLNEKRALDLEEKLEEKTKQTPEIVEAAQELARSTMKELAETRKTLADLEHNQARQAAAKELAEAAVKEIEETRKAVEHLERTQAGQENTKELAITAIREIEETRKAVEYLERTQAVQEKTKELAKNTVKELKETRKAVAELERNQAGQEKTKELAINTVKDLKETRKALEDLERNQAEQEKTKELAISAINDLEETRKELAELERTQEDKNLAINDKVTKNAAGFNAIKKRLEATEAKQGVIDERIESALTEQAKLIRKVDRAVEDRARFIRKIERIEETVIQTRDALNAKAMVLLTEQGVTAADTEFAAEIEEMTKGLSDYDEDLGGLQSIKASKHDVISRTYKNEAAREAAHLARIKSPRRRGKALHHSFFDRLKHPAIYAPIVTVAAILVGLVLGLLIINDGKLPSRDAIIKDITALSLSSYEPESGQMQATEINPPITQTAKVTQATPVNANTQNPSSALGEAKPIDQMQWAVPSRTAEQNTADNAPSADNSVDIDLDNQAQISALMDSDPQSVAQRLNQIEPMKLAPELQTAATKEILEQEQPAPANDNDESPLESPIENQSENQSENSNQIAPDAVTQTENNIATTTWQPNPVQAELIAEQIQSDQSLPEIIQPIEAQAFQGIGYAQFELAALYTVGYEGVEQNLERAAFWFEKAAENGIGYAAHNLGILYHHGLGVTPDIKSAMKLYKQAADQGHPEAQFNLGIAYIEGVGVPYDPIAAGEYFENAAKSGVIDAAYNLGLIHEHGLLGEAQPESALYWYKEAADKGSEEAKQALRDLSEKLGITLENNENTEDHSSNAGSSSAEQAIIAQIQEYLMREGLYPGPADGVNGALTQDAIRSYQSQSGLEQDGTPSQDLLSHMLAGTGRSALLEDNENADSSVNN